MSNKNSQEIPQLRIKEPGASRYTGMSEIWLRTQRMKGTGPAYLKVGRSVLYDVRDLDAYLEKHRVSA